MPSLNDILAVILGGGRGARLYPLTQMRSKPAVPIAGKYRLIDIPNQFRDLSHRSVDAIQLRVAASSYHAHL